MLVCIILLSIFRASTLIHSDLTWSFPVNYKSNLSMLKNFADASTFCFSFRTFYRLLPTLLFMFRFFFFSLFSSVANFINKTASQQQKAKCKRRSLAETIFLWLSRARKFSENFSQTSALLPLSVAWRVAQTILTFAFILKSFPHVAGAQNRLKFNEIVDSLRKWMQTTIWGFAKIVMNENQILARS